MITFKNVLDNSNIKVVDQKGCFTVLEHKADRSNDPAGAQEAFFMQQMNVRKRQVLCHLDNSKVRVQAGAMQWISGAVDSETGLGSGAAAVGGFLKGMIKSAVTKESAVKPVYAGSGDLMLEPTYKYILLEDVGSWGPGGIVLEDGLFLACDASLEESVVSRKSLSSVLGGEGLFNLSLKGNGIAVLESYVPREELYEFELDNDVLKIDGNMAIAWSSTLAFTVEKSSKSLMGAMVNGEGLVNVYRGTGKVLVAPTMPGTGMTGGTATQTAAASKGIGGMVKAVADLAD